MARQLWKLQSSFYHLFRSNPVSARILQQENEAIKILLKSVPEKRSGCGLDIGSGRGNSLELVIDSEANWVAIDYSPQMIRRCLAQYQEVPFILSDAREMPFKGESFEMILGIAISEYLEDLGQFLQEIWRLLRPGGYIILTLAPPHVLNYFRRMIGHHIYPIKEVDLRESLIHISLTIIKTSKTLLQNQYLLKKEER